MMSKFLKYRLWGSAFVALIAAEHADATSLETSPTVAQQLETATDDEEASNDLWSKLRVALTQGDKEQALGLIAEINLEELTHREREALNMLKLLLTPSTPVASKTKPPAREIIPNRKLPLYGAFSAKTNERIERNTFESLDHMSTLFTQGIITGTSLLNTELFEDADESVFLVPALSGLSYALFAAYTLGDDDLSRGDIPLIDGLAVYLPTHTLLLTSSVFWDNFEGDVYSWLYFGTSLASLPLAYGISRHLDPDPGDAQLIRDSVFWGGIFGWGSYFMFHPDDSPEFGRGFPLVTLGSSLAFGAAGYLLAQNSEYSLERIRSASLGGYIGGVVGGLLALAGGASNARSVTTILMTTSSLGLLLGFASTEELDYIPEGALITDSVVKDLTVSPAPIVYNDRFGQHSIQPGLVLSGRF